MVHYDELQFYLSDHSINQLAGGRKVHFYMCRERGEANCALFDKLVQYLFLIDISSWRIVHISSIDRSIDYYVNSDIAACACWLAFQAAGILQSAV